MLEYFLDLPYAWLDCQNQINNCDHNTLHDSECDFYNIGIGIFIQDENEEKAVFL